MTRSLHCNKCGRMVMSGIPHTAEVLADHFMICIVCFDKLIKDAEEVVEGESDLDVED